MSWGITIGIVTTAVAFIGLAIWIPDDGASDRFGIIGVALLIVAAALGAMLGIREAVWRYDRNVCAEYGRQNAVEVEFVFYGYWTWDCREIEP